ncbi:4Fe-4S binding protein [Hyphomicrobium sp.]|uniref:4Fe-4S binding protein n=1 Tax=Hyphomicrobium sp. TaxID=82 RepID=UPI002BC4DD40|nr:4Fe-4S binding protein [Hyphomicrobium sp.]HVZ03612.1 4Fe-4S binding protein [Hyphomicrobium sp.]
MAAKLTRWLHATLIACGILICTSPVIAKPELAEFAARATPQEFFPKATRFGTPQGEPPLLPVYVGDALQGYVYLNSDFTASIGYSGKPIHVLVGIDQQGTLTGFKLVDHKEPIVLVGVPEQRVVGAINKLIGARMGAVAAGTEQAPQPDIVSGATVTVLVMADSVVRSAVRIVKSGRLSPTNPEAGAAKAGETETKSIDLTQKESRDWQSLLGDGSVRHLTLTVAEINQAFEKSGNKEAAAHPEQGEPDDTFIDLYTALVSAPVIGRSLLGDVAHERLQKRLKPGQQALIIAGNGLYSFKGSGYVRGGIFDRIELEQGGSGIRFRDRNHERLGDLAAKGAPALHEIGLFTVPDDFAFDPTEPWDLRLLVQRSTGAREKAFLTFDLPYTLPDRYIRREKIPAAAAKVAEGGAVPLAASPESEQSQATTAGEEPFWNQMWRRNTDSIAITAFAIAVLTLIFFFQNALVSRPLFYTWVRRGFLAFTLVWLGWYANAQLSVVNVLTFTNALETGFSWEYFLTAPLIFILWSAVAISLLFWGRGPFCGWLCPFGALQELTNSAAKALGVPQLRVAWNLHERLWPIKYVIFLMLFGVSLYSIGAAEQLAEVEPFKTAIILKFVRDWPFVLFAAALLVAGLFVERFYCRYLCPLGAALAIPGRMRMFEWLRRWPDCGSPCQRCANECPVQSIHPEGHINANECIYCMHCQELYYDDHRCPHMIQVRLKRERSAALSLPSTKEPTKPVRPLISYVGKIVKP